MKSRTSYFNATAFQKNLTRFAPVWGLYTIAMFMGMFLMMDSGVNYWLYSNYADCIQFMGLVNLCYALLCAQLLFGDLYNARMCNMLHALPIRREGWFVTHVASALAFSFVPTGLMALAGVALAPFSEMVNAWQIPLLWWLGSNLEFVFFFGLACFSALCVGSRFAQAVVYGITNFAAILAYWLVDTLYTPMFYGLQTNAEPFRWFSPLICMADTEYIDCERVETFLGLNRNGYEEYSYHGEFTVTDEWWYLWVCAAVGIVLMALALQIYRKRRLETAGDFIALRPLEPVFLVIYTMVVGTSFHYIIDNLFGYGEGLVFLFVGLLVGWFTGKMLLERQIRVFRKRSFLGFGALLVTFVLSLVLAYIDPVGITRWVPDADDVASVMVGTGHGTYHQSGITLTEKEDIEKILAIHENALAKRIDETSWETVEAQELVVIPSDDPDTVTWVTEPVYKERVAITLEYKLKSGATKTRYYYVYTEDQEGQTLKEYFSTVEAVFGIPEEAMTQEYMDTLILNANITTYGALDGLDRILEDLSRAEKRELMDAILADCREGTVAQHYSFHRNEYDVLNVYFGTLLSESGRHMGREITVYTGNRHVVQWLLDMGYDVAAQLEEYYSEEYGKY